MDHIQNNYSILNLLPYEKDVILNNCDFELRILSLCKFFYHILCEALEAFFIEKNLLMFDAHVGENSCQIRAAFLVELSLKYKNIDSSFYNNHIDIIKKKLALIDFIITDVSTDAYRRSFDKKFVMLKSYLVDMNIIHKFSYDIYILGMLYFLTKYRGFDKNENIYIDYKLIAMFTKQLSRKMVHIYQIALSKYSVDYIKNISLDYFPRQIFDTLVQRDDDDRFVLPCFFMNKIIMNRLVYLNINIAVFVRDSTGKTHCYVFKYNACRSRYVYASEQLLSDLREPHYVIHVTAALEYNALEKMFRYLNLENFIDQKMAVHPQYGGLKLQALKNNPYSRNGVLKEMQMTQRAFLNHKINSRQQLGNEAGYNLLNIKHMFADIALNQIYMSKKNAFYIDQMELIWLNSLKVSEEY